MPNLKTPLEVYRLLPKTNCRQCALSSCMAFAAAVIKEEKELADCPCLGPAVLAEYGGRIHRQVNLETVQERQLAELREKIASIDLPSRAETLGGRMNGDSLVLSCLGRDFEIDAAGMVKSHCHTHAWFSIPLLDHVLSSLGQAPSGGWVPFRELPSGPNWSRLFEQRCEKPLRELADAHSELFADLIGMFSGARSSGPFDADVSVLLHPLPKVPVLVSCWKPEDGMESRVHLFFDDTAERHLHIDSLFTLGAGIARMLEKIMQKHTTDR